MSVQNAMTADFLRSVYGGESMAHMRYNAWGNLAEEEGFPNIGKLFLVMGTVLVTTISRVAL